MAEINSEYKAWKSSLLTILIVAAFLSAVILNSLFLFVFARCKKLRRAPNLFLLNVAVVDLLAAIFWVLPSVVAAAEWKWKLGGPFCKLHGFVGMFCFSINMFTLTVIAFEKFIKIIAPSKHSDAFYNYSITMVVVVSLWLLSTVVSFMPAIGWSRYKYFEYQMQCVTDFVESESHLNFFFINAFCIPIVVMTALYIATLIRIRILQRQGVNKDGQVILEEKKQVPGESFADKMRRQQEQFKYRHTADSSSRPNMTDSGGALDASDESDAYVSDDNEIFHDYEEYKLKKRERELARRRRKVYAFRRQYLFLALTMLAVTLIYTALWLPFLIITYTWVYDPDSVKEATYSTFAVITFFSVSYKPLIYMFNKHIRRSVKQAFTRHKQKSKKPITPDHIAKYKADDEQTTPPHTASGSRVNTDPIRGRGFERNDTTVDDMENIEF